MTEESLNAIPINDLFDLLMQTMKELLEVDKNDKTALKAKKEQVALLHKVIIEKRSEFRPG